MVVFKPTEPVHIIAQRFEHLFIGARGGRKLGAIAALYRAKQLLAYQLPQLRVYIAGNQATIEHAADDVIDNLAQLILVAERNGSARLVFTERVVAVVRLELGARTTCGLSRGRGWCRFSRLVARKFGWGRWCIF